MDYNRALIKGVFKIIGALCFISAILFLNSCGTIREVPVQEVTKVEVRDSLVYVRDTVTVEVPKERFKEVLPELDTSVLETDFSRSVAFLDTLQRQLVHTLENKPQSIEKPIEIPTKIITRTEYKEKEVPVEVPVPYTPKWCWILLVTCGAYFSFLIAKLIYKHHHL